MQENCEYQYYSLFDQTGNQTRVHRCSSKRSIHSTTDRVQSAWFNYINVTTAT